MAKVCFKKKKEGSCHTTHLVMATSTQEVNTTEGGGDAPDHFTVYMCLPHLQRRLLSDWLIFVPRTQFFIPRAF